MEIEAYNFYLRVLNLCMYEKQVCLDKNKPVKKCHWPVCEKVDFTKFFTKNVRLKLLNFHTQRVTVRKLRSFGKNFVKVRTGYAYRFDLTKNLLVKVIFSFSYTHRVEITEFYCHHFFAKIPWNQLFAIGLYSELIWRKKFCMPVNFSFFHTVTLGRLTIYATKLVCTVSENWFHVISPLHLRI